MPHSKTDYIDYEQPTPAILKHTKKKSMTISQSR